MTSSVLIRSFSPLGNTAVKLWSIEAEAVDGLLDIDCS